MTLWLSRVISRWEYRDEPPEGGKLQMWVVGVVTAAFPVVYGLICVVSQRAILFGRGGFWTATDSAAVGAGIAYFGLGAYLHFHWFWGLHRNLLPFSGFGRTVSLAAIGGGLVYTCFVVLVLG